MGVVHVADKIFRRQFPVGADDPLVRAADKLRAALAAIEKDVEIPGHVAEVIAQRRRFGIEVAEDEAFILIDQRNGSEAETLFVELAVIVLLEIRHADECAVAAIHPAVIRAGERIRIALLQAADAIAAMAADVQESAELAVLTAADEHRVFTHVRGQEVAGIF